MTPRTLRAKRIKLGLSQAQLAEQVSRMVLSGVMDPISRQTIIAMEKGERRIQPYILKYFELMG